jgi:hypothetical protein
VFFECVGGVGFSAVGFYRMNQKGSEPYQKYSEGDGVYSFKLFVVG